MHGIARMSDEERNRLVEESRDEVTEGLDLKPEFTARTRSAKSALPDDPSTEQLEAWIEPAALLRGPGAASARAPRAPGWRSSGDPGREPTTSSEAAEDGLATARGDQRR